MISSLATGLLSLLITNITLVRSFCGYMSVVTISSPTVSPAVVTFLHETTLNSNSNSYDPIQTAGRDWSTQLDTSPAIGSTCMYNREDELSGVHITLASLSGVCSCEDELCAVCSTLASLSGCVDVYGKCGSVQATNASCTVLVLKDEVLSYVPSLS